MTRARRAAPLLVSLAALAAVAACVAGDTCPSGAAPIATYAVSYSAIDAGDTCVVSRLPDGGATFSNLVTTPSSGTMLLCGDPADGGTPKLYLSGIALGAPDGATYAVSGAQSGVTGSACICSLDISDTVTVTLATADGGSFAYVDGGPEEVPSFTGRVDYAFQQTSGDGTACGCNVPCGAHYALSGSKK